MRTLEVVTALQQPATRHVARAARWAIVLEDAPAAAAIVVVKIRASGVAVPVLSMTHRGREASGFTLPAPRVYADACMPFYISRSREIRFPIFYQSLVKGTLVGFRDVECV